METHSYNEINHGCIEIIKDDAFWYYQWPIYTTGTVAIMGYSYDQNALYPEFWALQYKLT